MSRMLRYVSASDVNAQMVRDLNDELDRIYDLVGGQPDANGVTAAPPPTAAAFNVVGIDGKYLVFVTNPQDINPDSPTLLQAQANNGMNPLGTPIVHNLQSSTTMDFDQAGSVIDYGSGAQLQYEIQTPNQTRFFRLRSSYDGVNWNDWQVFSSSVTCGAIGVWSGMARSAAIMFLNSQAMTVDASNALTQDGTSTKINIAAKIWNVGPQQIAYLGGSVDPGVYGTFYIYGIDNQKVGGQITYLATQNAGVLTAADGTIVFGFVTTAGGGGGTGGGGGSCDVTGTLVDMYDGTTKNCENIVRGDVAKGVDGGPEVAQEDAEPIPAVPVFRLEFDNGVIHRGASSTHWLRRVGGQRCSVFDAVEGDTFRTRGGVPGILTKRTFLGVATVWRQRFDRTRTYIADGLEGHNLKPAPDLP